jgi:hypothetical protein
MHFDHTGSSDLDPEEEKAGQTKIKEKFQPLLIWMKKQVENTVRDGSCHVDLSAS